MERSESQHLNLNNKMIRDHMNMQVGTMNSRLEVTITKPWFRIVVLKIPIYHVHFSTLNSP